MNYHIITLGSFNVIKDGQSLLKASVNSKKVWELYKFMLTNKGQSFTAEMLTDQLWSEEIYSDSSATIRRQMHRLRILLNEKVAPSSIQSIVLTNGFYHWNTDLSVTVDSDEFIEFITLAEREQCNDQNQALEFYQKAIQLYSGDYLSESYNEHWVFPRRNYLHQLYIKAVVNVIQVLKQHQQFKSIITFCEKAIQIDYYEEIFHIQIIECYIKLGNHSKALEHLEKVALFLKKELGIELSKELVELKKQLLNHNYTLTKENITNLIDSNKNLSEVFFCDREVFKGIFELECRRSERNPSLFSLHSLQINVSNIKELSKRELYNKKIHEKLRSSFRKGDVFTQWNEHEYYILLSGIDDEGAQKVLERVFASDLQKNLLSIQLYTNRFKTEESRISS